jgi:hypothetical protein
MSEIDIERLKVDESLWPEGAIAYCQSQGVFLYRGSWLEECCMTRPNTTEWVDGLPPDSIAEFRKALALNLQNSIEAITGEAFGDDDSLILAHEMMVKYDISDKLKYTGD